MCDKRETDEFKDERERAEKILRSRSKKNKKSEIMRAFALVTQLGIQMACCVVMGVLSGIFLDRLFGTAPLFIIIFAIIGSAASMKVLYDISKDWKD